MSLPTTVTSWSAPTRDPGDAGHLIPADAWQAVVNGAKVRARQLVETAHGFGAARLELPDRTIAAVAHGGLMAGGPRLGVIHTAETPLATGYAYSIAANWFGTKAAGTSATVMCDPGETIRLLPDNVVSYAVGARANGFTVNVEQSGRASMGRAAWLTDIAQRQHAEVAQYMAECLTRWGLPLRWATDEQIRKAAVAGTEPQGWCLHDDIRRVLGGTTHTDAGTGYPRAVVMARALAFANPPAPSQPTSTTEGDPVLLTLPPGDNDYVIALRATDTQLKLVAFQGAPVKVHQINAMKPNAKGDVDGVGMAGAFELPRFHGPEWKIPAGCTCVVVNYSAAQPVSALVY